MKKYEKVKECIELLNSFKIGNNFKEIITREHTYLKLLIISSPMEKAPHCPGCLIFN